MTSSQTQFRASQLLKIILLITSAVSINGCGLSWLSSRATNPVIQDYAVPETWMNKRPTNVFATTSSYRLAIIAERDKKQLICAEPPPDVAEAFASAIAAGFTGKATVAHRAGATASPELTAQFARAVATQVAPLLHRSQGLQLFRDAAHKLCIDRMNEWINTEEYMKAMDARFDTSAKLIEKEVEANMSVAEKCCKDVSGMDVSTGETKLNIDDIIKALEEIKKGANAAEGAAKPAEGDGKKQ